MKNQKPCPDGFNEAMRGLLIFVLFAVAISQNSVLKPCGIKFLGGKMQISNEELHNHLVKLARQEREIVAEILKHLREIEKRRLYAEMGCSSLFQYCVEELKMSESAAGR